MDTTIKLLFLKNLMKEYVTQGIFVYVPYMLIFQVHKLHLDSKKPWKV